MAGFNFKFDTNKIIVLIALLFIASMIPCDYLGSCIGNGTKAADQQAIVSTEYTCATDKDCPSCAGGGIVKYNETATGASGFFGELSYAKCVSGVCQLSDSCLVWQCGNSNTTTCHSLKQTLLDNTLTKVNQHPGMLILGIILIALYFMLPGKVFSFGG